MNYQTILVSDDGPIRTITLNRPERRNAMTPEMQDELIHVLERHGLERSSGAGSQRCGRRVLLRPRPLCHFRAMNDKTAADHRADAERIAKLFVTLYELRIPTIAAVHGPAIAARCGFGRHLRLRSCDTFVKVRIH